MVGLVDRHVGRRVVRLMSRVFRPRSGEQSAQEDPLCVVELRISGMEVHVDPGRALLEQLSAAGVKVPSSCGRGVCGTCEQIIIEGEVDHRDHILSDAERGENRSMFPCVSRVLSQRLVLDL